MSTVIQHIETLLVDLPTIRPHKLSMTTMACQTMVIVRMRHSDGIEGLGEGTTIGGLAYGPESPESIKRNIDTYLAPLLVGQPSNNVHQLRARLNRHARGNMIAKSALETALLDAQGKRLGLSVAELLGGVRQDHLPVLWTLASGDTAKDIDEAMLRLEQRRHCDFKLKIGANPVDQDVRHVAAIKEALGDRASVRVDVNQAWDESTAVRGIQVLQDAGIELIEQPIGAREHAGLVRLANRFNVPMLADEAVQDARDGLDLVCGGFSGAFALKIAKSGGIYGVLELAHVAQAAGIGLYGGTLLEGTIGTAASLHAWATLPAMAWGTEMFGPLLLQDDIVVTPLNYTEFGVELPKGAGLGITLDEDKLAHYSRK
ncbi:MULTISPECIES: muconate/chloromuconate family cycloisomerase [Halomonadaceae]|uniref:Muconate cycloisomerase 1 n=1 Tax=Vreelandella titanicae TaxID=664683 RepID=A0AAP9NQ86_9GAMM|nr:MULTISPECIES: muconate/chloromuconate family cycloisomerase [Halomonas]MCD1589039.1 muconate/chloromuconate family cycloisomerase [Halomonas sp. IOP_14]QKS26065.1 Muconate cycloisomerase 1 [Halomonas titanicae]CDG52750.1 Muconate cycloisomerase 1 [Halomonas sp. A3H3]|tara:strand:- start:346 stop:1464 length:1119 start_codon:yes stop_codon:yes gene_type:complete